jgi:mercuric ion transport protein
MTGIAGSIIAMICCLTPALVMLLSAVGFAALIGYLGYVLLPAMAIFLGLIGYGWWIKARLNYTHQSRPNSLSIGGTGCPPEDRSKAEAGSPTTDERQ